MSKIEILKVNPENVRLMKVSDIKPLKGLGGIINYKYIDTFFVLLSKDEHGRPVLIDVTFKVPVQDYQSGRLRKGCNILVEKYPKGLKYLGVEGDWETMLSFGLKPNQDGTGILGGKYTTFSEEDNISFTTEEHETSDGVKTYTCWWCGAKVVELRVRNGILLSKFVERSEFDKLANDWLEAEGVE